MKKKNVKNRKLEIRKKRFFAISLLISFALVTATTVLAYLFFLQPPLFISPLASQLSEKIVRNNGQEINQVEKIKTALQQAKIQFQDVTLQPDHTASIILNDNEQVIVGFDKDLKVQIASLQLITARLTMEGKRFVRLDLRYDKPVITF